MALSPEHSVELISLNDVFTVGSRRPVSDEAVASLVGSIEKIGLRTPITVRIDQTIEDPETGEEIGGYAIVTGAHRVEACRRLGWEQIPAIIRDCTPIDAEMWEIAENLHRADLTALERSTQIDRWRELTIEKVRQAGAPAGGHQPREQGVRKVAKEFGLSEQDVRRAKDIASLSPEAKEAARETGLDDNRTALLAAARAPVEQQAAVVRQYAEKKREKPRRDIAGTDGPSDAEQFAAALRERFAAHELPAVISWLEGTKPRDVVGALRTGRIANGNSDDGTDSRADLD